MMATDWENNLNAEFNTIAVVTNNAKLSHRFANFTVVLFSTAVILYSSNIFYTGTDTTANASSTPSLILKTHLPFHYDRRRFVYGLVIIIQFLHLLLCSCAIGLLNALLVHLVSFIGTITIIVYII